MSLACLKAENSIPYVSHFEELCTLVKRPVPTVESCAMAAVRASLDLNASAIFVLSTSGESARLISKYRPVCPIIMITRNPSSSRYAHLYRGVYPFLFPEAKPDFTKVNWQEDVDRRIKWGLSHAIDLNILTEGETVVVVQGWKVRLDSLTRNLLHVADSDGHRVAWATPTRCGLSRLMSTTSALASSLDLVCSYLGHRGYGMVAFCQRLGRDYGLAIDLFAGMTLHCSGLLLCSIVRLPLIYLSMFMVRDGLERTHGCLLELTCYDFILGQVLAKFPTRRDTDYCVPYRFIEALTKTEGET